MIYINIIVSIIDCAKLYNGSLKFGSPYNWTTFLEYYVPHSGFEINWFHFLYDLFPVSYIIRIKVNIVSLFLLVKKLFIYF